MKERVLAILLIFCLCSCVPTPEKEYVINKGAADKTDVRPAFQESRENIPEHLLLEERPQRNITITIDADVLFQRDAVFPVLEVRPVNTVNDPSFCTKLLSALDQTGTVYEEWPRTKDEIQEELIACLSYHGQAGSLVEIDAEYVEELQKEYNRAPTEPDKQVHDMRHGFEQAKCYYVETGDGTIALLLFHFSDNGGAFCDEYRTLYYDAKMLEPGDDPLSPPTISEEHAIQVGDTFLKNMGLECNSLAGTDRGFVFSETKLERGETVWWLRYVREIEGTKSIDMRNSGAINYPKDPASATGAPWEMEYIDLVVGERGVVSVVWSGLTETAKVIQPSAALLDFDTVQQRIIQQLGFQYAMLPKGVTERTVHVSKVALVYGLICERDRDDVGLYIPMWEIYYHRSDDTNQVMQRMYLSALDGSTVEPRITRNELMRELMG